MAVCPAASSSAPVFCVSVCACTAAWHVVHFSLAVSLSRACYVHVHRSSQHAIVMAVRLLSPASMQTLRGMTGRGTWLNGSAQMLQTPLPPAPPQTPAPWPECSDRETTPNPQCMPSMSSDLSLAVVGQEGDSKGATGFCGR